MPQILRSGPTVSVAEAAEREGCHEQTIRRRIKDGTLPAERFGPRDIRINVADLERLHRPVASVPTEEVTTPPPPPDPIRDAALRVVAEAPKLTGTQLDQICALLRGAA